MQIITLRHFDIRILMIKGDCNLRTQSSNWTKSFTYQHLQPLSVQGVQWNRADSAVQVRCRRRLICPRPVCLSPCFGSVVSVSPLFHRRLCCCSSGWIVPASPTSVPGGCRRCNPGTWNNNLNYLWYSTKLKQNVIKLCRLSLSFNN